MSKKKVPIQFRQGDVFIVAVDSIPDGAAHVKRENGSIVLAHGEVTGHSHAIADRAAVLFDAGAAGRFLRVDRPVTLRHEEHGPIELPAANYRVTIQREYQPGKLPRTVLD